MSMQTGNIAETHWRKWFKCPTLKKKQADLLVPVVSTSQQVHSK